MPTPDEIKARIRESWTGAAEIWDRRHDELEQRSRSVNEWICQAARLKPGMSVLDLASGTGQPSLTAATLVASGGIVVATDVAPTMVEVIRRRARELGVTNLEAREMDMDALEFPDASFDAVTCRWGFMFSPQPVKAMAEARRVLREGSRLAAVTWDFGPENTWMSIARRAMAAIGAAPGGRGGAPPSGLDTTEAFTVALTEAGFAGPKVEHRVFQFEFPSGEDWWTFLMDFGSAVVSRSPEDQARVHATAVAEAETHRKGDHIELDAACICAVARK